MSKYGFFPDGTALDPWFYEKTEVSPGKLYRLQDHGIVPDGAVQTVKLQALIDRVSEEGGGTIVIGGGTFWTGALYLKQGVHLRLEAHNLPLRWREQAGVNNVA